MENGYKPESGKPVLQFEVSKTDGNSKRLVGFELLFKGYTDTTGIVKIALVRTGNLAGKVSPKISVNQRDTKLPDWISFQYTHADSFEEGQKTAYAYVDYEVNEENFAKANQAADPCHYILEIEPSGQYDIGQNKAFSLDFKLPQQ